VKCLVIANKPTVERTCVCVVITVICHAINMLLAVVRCCGAHAKTQNKLNI